MSKKTAPTRLGCTLRQAVHVRGAGSCYRGIKALTGRVEA